MLPPPDAVPADELTVPRQARPVEERWSVRLELADDDIAKLYGQGMTRGAVVWKKGMEEWRPLLITQELSGLLRRTRTTLTELPDLPTWPRPDAPLVLPPPPRLPDSVPPPAAHYAPLATAPAAAIAQPTTVAPLAMDVAEAPSKARRPIELIAVAVTAFALAWIGHSKLGSKATVAPPSAARAIAAAPQCEPAPVSPARSPGSGIPTVSVADLPLAGAHTPAAGVTPANASSRAPVARSSSSNESGPSRSALVSALSQVARSASGCGERGGPVRVVMTFAGSGVARSIQVSGQDLPAGTKSCIIGAASRARVPAFSGDPVTVAKTL